jgi:hypothetical protein
MNLPSSPIINKLRRTNDALALEEGCGSGFVNGYNEKAKESSITHLDVLRVLRNDTSRNTLGILHDLRNRAGHICGAILRLRRFLRHDNKVRHEVRGNLVVRLDQGRVEFEEGLEGRTRNQGRV